MDTYDGSDHHPLTPHESACFVYVQSFNDWPRLPRIVPADLCNHLVSTAVQYEKPPYCTSLIHSFETPLHIDNRWLSSAAAAESRHVPYFLVDILATTLHPFNHDRKGPGQPLARILSRCHLNQELCALDGRRTLRSAPPSQLASSSNPSPSDPTSIAPQSISHSPVRT